MADSAHHIYWPAINTSDLQQGDILLPTEELSEVFGQVHKDFADDKYNAFLVLTQTCDLVRNRGPEPCKSQYVNLAAVRPLEHVLHALLDVICEPVKLRKKRVNGAYILDTRNSAERLLGRIVNQNEESLGIFYLPPHAEVGIAYHSVALLQVSIALRAEDYYSVCVGARRGRLTEVYRDRLGWIVGNLFSRIATDDVSRKHREDFVKCFLYPSEYIENPPEWVPRASVASVNRAAVDIRKMGRDEIISMLKAHKPDAPLEVAIERVVQAVREAAGEVRHEVTANIAQQLRNDDVFKQAVRPSD